ncbi:protein-disulfide reductase DsbD family protein [Longitalea luteola]|uniref:protein-disulfide reductase DsbD family protein n=1 Tax=Longitalea luteola TaxID=2812563 RepID=UPI001A97460E|nr:thioredoxin family protein [Longitalea luteola]
MSIRSHLNTGLSSLLLILFLLTGIQPAFSQDTVSTDDVEFTPITDSVPAVLDTASRTVMDSAVAVRTVVKAADAAAPQSLPAIFIAGLLGGFAAVLMPCIFPMLPMTVSFFTKSATGKGAVGRAVIYGLSIIVLYVLLGLLITVLFGADALNDLSTNGIFNFFFFALLVVFAASFLGAFEIVLPSGWVNKVSSRSGSKGLAGIFFMAATLALVSFSCTGPIIGTLLVQAATTGALLGPAVGMFGFSFALALPFTLFALFPSWLNALPRSGGWLNSVKVTLGFIELALALKFLSNVDLAYHWNWFDREVFLVLWIVIFGLLGMYLLGKLRFSHDSAVTHITVPRLFLSIICLAFTIYLVPGLWGAPLKSVSAFLPPMSSQDFDLSSGIGHEKNKIIDVPRKYADLFEAPKGFQPFFDYEEGIAYAQHTGKPVMIDFTGHACVNCRKMEANVWPDGEVAKLINDEYVLIQLYVDDKTSLPDPEQYTTPEGRRIKTIGNKWSFLQTSVFKANSQPFYVLLDPKTKQLLAPPQGADYDVTRYKQFLKNGLSSYEQLVN